MSTGRSTLEKILFPFLAGVMSLAICLGGAPSARAETEKSVEAPPRKMVAKVNGQPIYDDVLAADIQHSLKKFKKFAMHNAEEPPELMKKLEQEALERAISQELLYQASSRQKIADSKVAEAVATKLDAMKKRYGSDADFLKGLKAKGLTEKTLLEALRKSVYLEEYLKEKGISDVEAPESEVKDYYDKHTSAFQTEEMVKVSHILIKTEENAAPDKLEEAKKKAEAILGEIRDGKDFGATAKKYSECNTAPGGGELGYVRRGFMPEEFDKVAFELEKGAVSGLVKTKYGYHILKVSDKKPKGTSPYEDVKEFISKYLKDGLVKEKLAAHVGELRQRASIETFLEHS